jgi:outer membrane protein OmpA-like peptidoglycan-associated protein
LSRLAQAALGAAFVLSGCASGPFAVPKVTPALFVVVPAPDGHVGQIVIHRCGEARVIDTAYGAERLGSDGSVRTLKLTEAEVRREFGPTLAALPGMPTSFTLYFLEGSDELTGDSRAELDRVLAELKQRPLPDIMVIGHTDTVGTSEYNDELSRARAERMREVLVGIGLPRDRIQVAGRGERELMLPTADNVPEPRNRRVEISVR